MSAVIFNALVIVALIPLALRGIKYRSGRGVAAPSRSPSHLRPRGDRRAVRGHQGHRPPLGRLSPRLKRSPSCSLNFALPSSRCSRSPSSRAWRTPLLITGVAPGSFPHQAEGTLVMRDGKPVGSRLIGQSFDDPKYFWGRLSATADANGKTARVQRRSVHGIESRPHQLGAHRRGQGACRRPSRGGAGERGPHPGRPRHVLRQRSRSRDHPPPRPSIRCAASRRRAGSTRRAFGSLVARAHGRPSARNPR